MPISTTCSRFYFKGQGKEPRNEDTNRNEKAGQANSRKEEKLVGTSARMPSERAPTQLSYYQPIRRLVPGRLSRRW
jgi:hypothetical protein